MAQVGRAAPGPLRGADAQEVHVTEVGGRRGVGAELELAALHVPPHQLSEARLVEAGFPGLQPGDLASVDVDAEDRVTKLGHAGSVRSAEVPGTHHRDARAHAALTGLSPAQGRGGAFS